MVQRLTGMEIREFPNISFEYPMGSTFRKYRSRTIAPVRFINPNFNCKVLKSPQNLPKMLRSNKKIPKTIQKSSKDKRTENRSVILKIRKNYPKVPCPNVPPRYLSSLPKMFMLPLKIRLDGFAVFLCKLCN